MRLCVNTVRLLLTVAHLALEITLCCTVQSLQLRTLSVCLFALFIATPTDRCYGTVDFWLIAVACAGNSYADK